MTENIAIASLVVGETYQDQWTRFVRPTWEAYAERHGYDIVTFEQPLDTSDRAAGRSVAWQKCLILSQDRLADYDRVIWVDADVVINPRKAPDIVAGVAPEKVGGVISGDYLHEDLKATFVARLQRPLKDGRDSPDAWKADQAAFYHQQGFSCITHEIIQTGVLVLSPAHHRELLETVYAADYPSLVHGYEQMPLSAAILNRDLFQRLDSRFNYVFPEIAAAYYPFALAEGPYRQVATYQAIQTAYMNCFFLHLAESNLDLAAFLFPEQAES